MSRNKYLEMAYSELGEASADLHFAGYNRLSKIAKDLQDEVNELIDYYGGEE